ncbi:hypothetical protein M0G43_03750 [Subsaxibacter sp. CAU 1640]|uniref:hypothetical protein n=1 Tax=Subsaxibacter sp. CAU 1640 TaxID=2933271 RepID=UPI002006074B|nr:hypothetical protein [Subsaxibacter sp. CAU 1640]MCK7589677.1 hypothetical protein [Subsaxibacter sp. CAU 1640]
MRQTIFFVTIFFSAIATITGQNNTTADFDLPENTVMYATGTVKYNGETKQLTPISQTQYSFKDRLLTLEREMTVIGDLKLAGVKNFSYDANNQLIRITDSGGAMTNDKDAGASHEDYKITTSKKDNILNIYRNNLPYTTKTFNSEGKLVEEDTYDYQGKYVLTNVKYNSELKITRNYSSDRELSKVITEYLDKNEAPIVEVVFEPKNPYFNTVTYFSYAANGDLQSTTTYKHTRDKLKSNFQYVKDGKPTEVPKEASTLTPTTITYYNYSEGQVWAARIPDFITSNEITITVRAIQTSDGKENNIINDQKAFMKFLDETYQKIKAKK